VETDVVVEEDVDAAGHTLGRWHALVKHLLRSHHGQPSSCGSHRRVCFSWAKAS
jgi:hypothetical protein